jgi:formyltetrahydrofolate deformylase
MDLLATLQCADQPGIVHAMTTAILNCGGNIIENQQFTDPTTKTFVMRTRFETSQGEKAANDSLDKELSRFSPSLSIRPTDQKPRALILVTKESHCLRDLLYLFELGELHIDIPLVISNHPELKDLVESHGIPFLHLPVSADNKDAQEKAILAKIAELKIDFVVLARYMQVLSKNFCNQMPGKIINIHHSFLPGFKGAKPYHQAHRRGVKLIGATCHFVTPDLDEGPIVEQDVIRIDHSDTPEDMAHLGKDIEKVVLARGLRAVVEDRVLLAGNKTVIFR